MRRQTRLAFLSFAIALFARAAHAQEAPPAEPQARASPPSSSVRTAGTIVLDDILSARSSGPLPLTVGWLSYRSTVSRSGGGAEVSMTQLRVAPSLDVFVVDGVSIGGQAAIGRAVQDAGTTRIGTSTREIAPRLGYAIAIGDAMTFWTRAHAAYGWVDTDVEAGTGSGALGAPGLGTSTAPGTYWRVGADASLLLSLGRYVAFAVGPTLAYTRQRSQGAGLAGTGDTVTTSFDVAAAASLRLVL